MNENKDLNKNSEQNPPKNIFEKILDTLLNILKTLGRWTKRMFMGASRDYEQNVFEVEKLESPSKMAVKSFFRRKISVAALVILILMFLFVFIGPKFIEMDISPDSFQINKSPNYSYLKPSSNIKNDVVNISSFSSFTIGLNSENEIGIWGDTKNPVVGYDISDIPEELDGKKIAFAAAGSDHVVVITTEGKVVCWGNKNNGQYGLEEVQNALIQPAELVNGTLNVDEVKSLVCGKQVTAILMKNGTCYIWGNTNTNKNIAEFTDLTNPDMSNLDKVIFSSSYAIGLTKDGKVTTGKDYKLSTRKFVGKKVVDIAASEYSVAGILEDGSILITGTYEKGEDNIPNLTDGDKFVKISAGTTHYAAVTEKGYGYSWGNTFYGQATDKVVTDVSDVFCGANQTYFVNEDNEITVKYGLKGFIMGTDGQGRDLFARIVHGGKMTMTIGAVAVIISTIIAIIVGCLSGYFGGWVDMLLMRITEIFSALPFLPFAMMLSVVIQNYNVPETTRIFIIMVILGLLSWTGLARMIRGQVLAEREKEFVIAAKAMGVKEKRIAFKHILPNVVSVILVSVTLDFAGCMLTESSLSYLGFGVQQPQPTWGNLLNGCNNSIVIKNYYWQWLFPALFLGVATICVNIIGDGLRDVLDPKSSAER